MKHLAISCENFADLIRHGCYYADKTEHIRAVIEDKSRVLVLTRPRRFGKTLFMDTLKSFLQVDFENPGATDKHEKLFAGLCILKHSDFCRQFMGQYPVLILSLKDAYGDTFEAAHKAFTQTLRCQVQQLAFLADSPQLLPEEAALFRRYLTSDRLEDAHAILGNLVRFVAKHFGRPVVLLIDEYDVPLAKAAKYGYLPTMTTFMKSIMDEVLRNNPDYLRKVVITGCLPVTESGLFNGISDLSVSAVTAQDVTFATTVGFTASDVTALLAHYGLSLRWSEVELFYGAYSFAQNSIYCPWDVLNFAAKALSSGTPGTYAPKGFWVNTSGNSVVLDFIRQLSTEDADRLQALIKGAPVSVECKSALSYANLPPSDSAMFWSLLLHTGYLTEAAPSPGVGSYIVRFPNQEIRELVASCVQHHFSKANPFFVESARAFIDATLTGDGVGMERILRPLADTYVSVENQPSGRPLPRGLLWNLLESAPLLVKGLCTAVPRGSSVEDFLFTNGTGSHRVGVVIRITSVRQAETVTENTETLYAPYFVRLRCGRQVFYRMTVQGRQFAIAEEPAAG